MGRCGWRKECDLEVAAPQPPSLLDVLPEHSSHAWTHSSRWQCDAAAAIRDPGKSENSGVVENNSRSGMKGVLCHVKLFSKDGIALFSGNSKLWGNLGGQVTRAKRRATSSSWHGDTVYNKQKPVRGGRDFREVAGAISMETLNLLQWVPSGVGIDQVLWHKSAWHRHGRILSACTAGSEMELPRPAIQHTRKIALKWH